MHGGYKVHAKKDGAVAKLGVALGQHAAGDEENDNVGSCKTASSTNTVASEVAVWMLAG